MADAKKTTRSATENFIASHFFLGGGGSSRTLLFWAELQEAVEAIERERHTHLRHHRKEEGTVDDPEELRDVHRILFSCCCHPTNKKKVSLYVPGPAHHPTPAQSLPPAPTAEPPPPPPPPPPSPQCVPEKIRRGFGQVEGWKEGEAKREG